VERHGDAIRFHPTLIEFARHYRYEPRPVAVAWGNEKGRVERAIRYVRDNFFAARQFTDVDDLNIQAEAWCFGVAADRRCPGQATISVREAFAEEVPQLLALPDHPYPLLEFAGRACTRVRIRARERGAHLPSEIRRVVLIRRGLFRNVALHGAPPAYAEGRRREPMLSPIPGTTTGRVAATKQPVQISDIRLEPAYASDPKRFTILHHAGARTMLNVPMLKDSELIGQIAIYRQEVRPFTDKQIELVSNFAAQAVIAIENTRLLNELRESLQQQIATSEVLGVISSSPGELEPVFQAMLSSATRICEAKFGNLLLYEGGQFRVAAMQGASPAWAEKRSLEPEFRPGPNNRLALVAKTKQVQHVVDLTADQSYIERDPASVAIADIAGARTILLVPMLKEQELVGTIGILAAQRATPAHDRPHRVTVADLMAEQGYVNREPAAVAAVELGGTRTLLVVPMLKKQELIGTINIFRQEVRPFTDKQIALVTNFCRPSCHRHRERAAAQRAARVVGAADGDVGGAGWSSPARPATWNRSFRRCWRTQCAFAKASSAPCTSLPTEHFVRSGRWAYHQHYTKSH
jgi:GAF domain-containing protein